MRTKGPPDWTLTEPIARIWNACDGGLELSRPVGTTTVYRAATACWRRIAIRQYAGFLSVGALVCLWQMCPGY